MTRLNLPTARQISEYITESNWKAFLKRHMDAIDEKRTFKDNSKNAAIFTKFIQSAFKFLIQENLLNQQVIDDVKDLNYMTVDMEIFVADGRNILQQLDIRSLLNLEDN